MRFTRCRCCAALSVVVVVVSNTFLALLSTKLKSTDVRRHDETHTARVVGFDARVARGTRYDGGRSNAANGIQKDPSEIFERRKGRTKNKNGRAILDLDSISLRKNVSERATGDAERCNLLLKSELPRMRSLEFETETEEADRWQAVVEGARETFVFSAFYDARTIPPVVRIIGISSGRYMVKERRKKYCQMWYSDEDRPHAMSAEYSISPETHERSYAASFHACYLRHSDGKVPYAVSLTSEKCGKPVNVLRVRNNRLERPPRLNYTVCVTPLNFNYDNYHQLVEMIEVNRMFGAQRFVFYNHSTGGKLGPFLRSYEAAGLVEVVPWSLPVQMDVWPHDPKIEPEIHYFGQLASLNDCLYRNMFVSRFVVFTDLDEIVVPRRRDGWTEMLEEVNAEYGNLPRRRNEDRVQFPGAYLFRNTFFRTDWPDDTAYGNNSVLTRLGINVLLKTTREMKIFDWFNRSKFIAWTKAVVMVGVHSVLNFVDESSTNHVRVDAKDGLLQHYRLWMDNPKLPPVRRVRDETMKRFADKIVSSVKKIYVKVGRVE